MKEGRLSLYEIMKHDMEEELQHGIKVANLLFRLGRKLGMSYDQAVELATAGLLHDLGKLTLSGYLYGQEAELLEVEEMVQARSHARIAYDILMRYDYSDFILETILYHHENYDGSGYPRNLVATEIPKGARMLRIVDSFVALTSDRSCRKAFTKDVAIEIMIDQIKNYDMQYFLTFLTLIHEIEEDVDKVINFSELQIDFEIKEENL